MADFDIFATAALVGYGLGSVPFGMLLARLGGYGDIRRIGSGNIGATNVLRTGNKALAFATFLLDASKGAGPVLLTGTLAEPGIASSAAAVAGVAAVLGHNFPVWLKFRGGKGVATTLGVLTALAWPVGLATAALWLATALIFKYSSLAALVSITIAPVLMLWLASPPAYALAASLLALLGIIRHHENIRRLIAGVEPKIGEGRGKKRRK